MNILVFLEREKSVRLITRSRFKVPSRTLRGKPCSQLLVGKQLKLSVTAKLRDPWALDLLPAQYHGKDTLLSGDGPAIASVTYWTRTSIRSCNIFTADRCVCRCDSTGEKIVSQHYTQHEGKQNLQLVPLPPPRAVQSTAIRSASPVSTVYDASMKTERDLRSRISIEGS